MKLYNVLLLLTMFCTGSLWTSSNSVQVNINTTWFKSPQLSSNQYKQFFARYMLSSTNGFNMLYSAQGDGDGATGAPSTFVGDHMRSVFNQQHFLDGIYVYITDGDQGHGLGIVMDSEQNVLYSGDIVDHSGFALNSNPYWEFGTGTQTPFTWQGYYNPKQAVFINAKDSTSSSIPNLSKILLNIVDGNFKDSAGNDLPNRTYCLTNTTPPTALGYGTLANSDLDSVLRSENTTVVIYAVNKEAQPGNNGKYADTDKITSATDLGGSKIGKIVVEVQDQSGNLINTYVVSKDPSSGRTSGFGTFGDGNNLAATNGHVDFPIKSMNLVANGITVPVTYNVPISFNSGISQNDLQKTIQGMSIDSLLSNLTQSEKDALKKALDGDSNGGDVSGGSDSSVVSGVNLSVTNAPGSQSVTLQQGENLTNVGFAAFIGQTMHAAFATSSSNTTVFNQITTALESGSVAITLNAQANAQKQLVLSVQVGTNTPQILLTTPTVASPGKVDRLQIAYASTIKINPVIFEDTSNITFAPTNQKQQSSLGAVSGTITTSTGGPLAGATVIIGGLSTTTDSQGNYTISNLSPGNGTLHVSASGYTDNTKYNVVVTAGSTTSNQNVVLTAVSSGNVGQTVQQALAGKSNFTDIKNALVAFAQQGASQKTAALNAVKGLAVLTSGQKDILTRELTSLQTTSSGSGQSINSSSNVNNVTTGTISGTITKSSGGGLAGATVTIGSQSSITDASGNYTVSGIAAGTYIIQVSASGYTANTKSNVVVAAGSTLSGQNVVLTAVSNGNVGQTVQQALAGKSNFVDIKNTLVAFAQQGASQKTAALGAIKGLAMLTPGQKNILTREVNRS